MNNVKKILLATGLFPPEIGGPATYAKMLVDELPKHGIEVVVLPFSKGRKYPRGIRHLVYAFKVWSQSKKVDLVFTQDPVSTGLPVVLGSCQKVVMRVAGDYAWEQAYQRFGVKDSIDDFQNKKYGFKVGLLRSIQRYAVRKADAVITPSKYFSNLVSRWNNGKKEITTIYNGVDLSEAVGDVSKFEKKTIISAGRLVPWKGFDVLIRSLSELTDWRLLIAGDGDDKNRLKQIAIENKVEGRVEFLGNLSKSELNKQIAQSHIFALLSTFESFSFQTVEAMNLGLPVIVCDVGNLKEIVDNNINGVLIKPNDSGAFAQAVKNLDADRLGKAAKEKAKQFSKERTIMSLLELFDKIKS